MRNLHRPMFRRGGSAGDGITSGLRSRYDNGGLGRIQTQLDLIDKLAPQQEIPQASSLNDFLINWGLNMASASPTGNIIQTGAEQAKEPFKQFQSDAATERAMKYKSGADRRSLVADLVKNLDDEDLNSIEQKIQLRMRVHNEDYETASKAVWDSIEYSKSGHIRPGQKVDERINFYENYLMNETIKPPAAAVKSIAQHLYKIETGGYLEQLGEQGVADLGGKYVWFSDMDIDQGAEGGPVQIENGEIIKYKLSQNGINKWSPYKGKIIFDHRTGKLFRVMGGYLEVVENINEE